MELREACQKQGVEEASVRRALVFGGVHQGGAMGGLNELWAYLKTDCFSAAPARVLPQGKGVRFVRAVFGEEQEARGLLIVARTPGRASGPKWPWPGVSS